MTGLLWKALAWAGIPDSLIHEFVRLMKEYGTEKAVVMTTQVTYEGSNIGVYGWARECRSSFLCWRPMI